MIRSGRWILRVLTFTTVAVAACNTLALTAPIDDIQLQVSSDVCDGSTSPKKDRHVIYAVNTNNAARISFNFGYDSDPAAEKFSLLDAQLSPFSEVFPKQEEIRVAPGGRAPVGCSDVYRSNGQIRNYMVVPLVYSKVGAVEVDPSQPEPAPEDFRRFAAFFIQNWEANNGGCPAGPKPTGTYFVTNLHPYKRLTLSIDAMNGSKPVGQLKVDLAPLSNERLTCTNGPFVIGQVTAGALH